MAIVGVIAPGCSSEPGPGSGGVGTIASASAGTDSGDDSEADDSLPSGGEDETSASGDGGSSGGVDPTDAGDPGNETTGDPIDPFRPMPAGCITSIVAGVTDYDCDGLVTTVSVPASCLSAPCGVIADIHGASMSAAQQDKNTNMRALGSQYGYIVVQPTTDGFSWSAGHEHRIMTGVLDVIEAFDADEDRVHVTGFSAGGGATWVILCSYPEVFASAAPAAATGQYLGAAPVCFGSNPPSPEMDLLYINGVTDPFETMDYVGQLVGKIVLDWNLDAGNVIAGDGNYDRLRRHNASGTVFDLLTHNYETDQTVGVPPLGAALLGHCYPGSTDHTPTLPGQLAGYGCKGANAFDYGETVIEFFVEHPK